MFSSAGSRLLKLITIQHEVQGTEGEGGLGRGIV